MNGQNARSHFCVRTHLELVAASVFGAHATNIRGEAWQRSHTIGAAKL